MANTQQTDGLFAPAQTGVDPEVARLKAELQVEKDRHRVLVEKEHRVENAQRDAAAADALKKLEDFSEADDTSTPAA